MQTYMRRLAEVLSTICEDAREPFVSISLNDAAFNGDVHPNPVHCTEFIGARRNKAMFIVSSVKALRTGNHRLAVLGHLNLAATARWLQKFGLLDGYVIVLHGIEAWERKRKALRNAARHASAIVATTRFTACEFQVQNGFAHPHMFVVPIGLPADSPPAPATPCTPHLFTVLTVGRLDSSERYKGMDTLISAAGTLSREGIPIRLRIVGDGDDRKRLIACAQSAAPGAVEFLGNVPDHLLPGFYAGCDIFAMPSNKEGFGLVFLEAMSHGKPCIGGRHGGTPEVIRDGVDGFLVEYGDQAELESRLRQLIQDDEGRERLGRNAYLRAASGFAFPVMRGGWRQVLAQLAI